MALPRSPLAPESVAHLPAIDGVRLASRACGIKYRGRSDVCLMAFDPGTAVAGVFTRSKTASAPVDWCRRALVGGRARAVLVNSGLTAEVAGRHSIFRRGMASDINFWSQEFRLHWPVSRLSPLGCVCRLWVNYGPSRP